MREFEPAAPGSWTLASLVESTHEACHALAACLLGITDHEARIDRPDRGVLGHVVTEKLPERADAWKHVALSLAPLIHAKRCPSYRPSLLSDDDDEFKTAIVVYERRPHS